MRRAYRMRLLPGAAAMLVSAAWVSGGAAQTGRDAKELLEDAVLQSVQSTGWTGAEWGVLAVSLEHGDTLVALNPDAPLAPASNQKLFTSAAALHHLGPDFRFPTFLLTDGEIVDGILEGSLFLYGTGDPAISDRLLDSPHLVLRGLAGQLRTAGIHTVSGELRADATFFTGPNRSPTWRERYLDNWYAAPVSALTFQENVVTLRMRGADIGTPARLIVEPAGAGLRVLNRSVSIPGNSRRRLFLVRDDPRTIRLEGQIGREAGELSRVLTVSDPPEIAASVLKAVLEDEGIRVLGGVSRVHSPGDSELGRAVTFAPAFAGASGIRTLAVHYSPPLHELIRVLNHVSHNLYAEILLFTIGRVASGDGSLAGGKQALGRFLTEVVGIAAGEVRIEDGSGLSARNRATPSAYIELLRHVASTEYAEPLWASLPEAGRSGGLIRRMARSPAAGNLRAKTGTIRGVSGLSGIVTTADGEPVLFSILSNSVPSSSRAKRIEDAIGIELASFSRAPRARATQ